MSVVDDFLKKMKMVSDDDEDYDDDYDDYGDEDEDDEILSPKKSKVTKSRAKKYDDDFDDDFDDDDEDDDIGGSVYTAPAKKDVKAQKPAPKATKVLGMDGSTASMKSPEVCMIVPKSFDDANTIADVLLSNRAVVLNLEGIDMAAAQRIIDFASGSCYTVGGNLQKISKKIFIVVPPQMNLSGDFDQLVGDMIDLNSVNMMK